MWRLQFPKDPEKLIIGHTDSWPEKGISIPPGYPLSIQDVIPGAYAMHERCWALLTRTLDVNLIKENLDLFVKVFCEKAAQNRRMTEFLFDEQDYWREPDSKYFDLSWKEPKRYAKVCEHKLSRLKGCFDGHCAPRDPFNVPELRDVTNSQKMICRKRIEKQA